MATMSELVHPITFIEDRRYLCLQGRPNGGAPVLVPVRFITYDPCPAFVIVRTGPGRRIRCLREDLFACPQEIHSC